MILTQNVKKSMGESFRGKRLMAEKRLIKKETAYLGSLTVHHKMSLKDLIEKVKELEKVASGLKDVHLEEFDNDYVTFLVRGYEQRLETDEEMRRRIKVRERNKRAREKARKEKLAEKRALYEKLKAEFEGDNDD